MCDLGLLTSWNFNFQNDKTYSSLVLPETGHCSGHWRYSSELDRGVKLCGARLRSACVVFCVCFKEHSPGIQKARIPTVRFAAN